MFKLEKLEVWQHALQYTDVVYAIAGQLPTEERFGPRARSRGRPAAQP
jgi:hypothetical protein